MYPKKFALFGGIIMLLMGVISLLPQTWAPAVLPALKVDASYGLFLGLFPMNIFNKLALIFFGVGGIMAATNKKDPAYATQCYAKWVFWVMAPAAILGVFSATNTLFGFWPLFGAEVLAHGVFALAAAFIVFGNVDERLTEKRRIRQSRMPNPVT